MKLNINVVNKFSKEKWYHCKMYMIKGLQNDHKTLMKQIEQGLGEVHSEFRGTNSAGTSAPSPTYTNGFAVSSYGDSNQNMKSFAKVGCVQEGSPADLGVIGTSLLAIPKTSLVQLYTYCIYNITALVV